MVLVLKDNERLHLTTWEYNMCRIMSRMAEIVESEGGRVKPYKTAIISDRTMVPESDPITVTHTLYISFVYGDRAYYVQFDDNPFFPFFYRKTPILDGNKYSLDICSRKLSKDPIKNGFLTEDVSDDEIDICAHEVLSELISVKDSKKVRQTQRVAVPNAYNDGVHYETTMEPERIKKIDF